MISKTPLFNLELECHAQFEVLCICLFYFVKKIQRQFFFCELLLFVVPLKGLKKSFLPFGFMDKIFYSKYFDHIFLIPQH